MYEGVLAIFSTEHPTSALVCRFVAEILDRTLTITDDAAHQKAVQAFVDELRPWMPSASVPIRSHAPLFAKMDLEQKTGQVDVELTPEGLMCFRGWLQRQGLNPMVGTS